MNTTILCEISYQVEHGNPQWGMLMANEYTRPDSILRKALAQRFRARVGDEEILSPLNKNLLEGRTKSEIPAELGTSIGARSIPADRKVPSSHLAERLSRRRTLEHGRRSSTKPLRRAA